MRRITNDEMRDAVQAGLSDPRIQQQMREANEAKSLGVDTIGAYVRDWGLIMNWTGLTSVSALTEETFFIIVERFIGIYSVGRVENFRSTVAWRQKLDLSAFQWSQTQGFQMRFTGFLKRVEEVYRRRQAEGLLPPTKRGHIQGEKVQQLFDYCVRVRQNKYAAGLVLSYHLMLRHGDLLGLDDSCIRHSPDRGWEVKIIGGKGRPEGFIEWINADDAPDLCEALQKVTSKGALLFPNWDPDIANGLMKAAAATFGWCSEGEPLKFTHHCNRRGKARDLYLDGLSIDEICTRGRWGTEKMAKGYIGQV